VRVKDRWYQWPAIVLLAIATGHCVFSAWAEPLSHDELQSGWLRLFDGTMSGWTATGDWQMKDNTLTSDMSFSRRIITAYPLPDFLLKFDYRLSATPSGAALRIRTSRDGEPAESGYRIPLSDSSKDWPVGSIVNRSAAQAASLSLNAWHSVTVEALGDHIKVEIDGRTTADIYDDAVHSGCIAFESTRGVALDVRDVRAKPLNIKQIFDGTDLAGWKNVPYEPSAKKGLFHVFGGDTKPHSAEWSVKAGAVHGEKGPGSIESGTSYENFVLQLKATANADPNKKDAYPALYARNGAGTFGTGYPIGIGAHIGEIGALSKPRKPVDNSHGNVLETIIADGRNFYIFLDGTLASVYHDTRPEATSLKQGARVSSGAFSLEIPKDVNSVDFSTIAAAAIPAGVGGVVKPLPPVAQPSVAAVAAPGSTATDTAAQTAQIAAALGVPTPQARSQTAGLISRAVKSDDPQEQMQLYDQVIKIDPNNSAAIQGYKEAQQKLEQEQQQQAQQQQASQTQQAKEGEAEKQLQSSLASAEASFLGGHIRDANSSLLIAERIAPSNPMVSDLRSRINAAMSLRRRLYFTGGAVGLAALFGGGFFLFRRRRSSKHPVLEVLQGLDQGRKYPLDRDVVRIGAVVQDGGQKNDIVVRDVEHLVSRFHCELIRRDGRLLLKDMNSSNGTKVNGEAVLPGRSIPLKRGARIDLGGTVVLRLGYERKRA